MSTEERVDGRRLRSVRTRRAIVDALLALIEEGSLKPTAPQIAARAEVSLRTVFQHFAEIEVLFAAVSERQIERLAERYEPVDPTLPLGERLTHFVRQRAAALEFVAPVARVAHLREPFAPAVRAELQRFMELNRQELATTFASELDTLEPERRALVLPAIEALATWRMWEVLRADSGLAVDVAEAVMRLQISAVFAAEGFELDR
jgi:TetR/AcrR family transcriptional regulator, regulator of autoinduction and epiphytic fitness